MLDRHLGIGPPEIRAQLSATRCDRLRQLALALGSTPSSERTGGEPGSVEQTAVREADPPGRLGAGEPEAPPTAWRVLSGTDVLPFELRTVSPGLAEVGGALRLLGERVARSAAIGLASVVGGEVSVRGRLLPGVPEPGASALVPLELTALAGQASLLVDCGFACRLAERVAGATPRTPVATSISPAARAVVELAVLGALDGLAAETDVETALAPRLGIREGAPARPLCVELTIAAAGTEGRALLVLPGDALRALSRTVELPGHLAEVAVPGSLRSGSACLPPSELASFREGDVLVLDTAPGEQATLRLRGGLSATGRLDGDSLEVTEVALDRDELEAEDLPVVLDVELASVPVPLRDVARIAPGALLLLGLERDGRVALRIGERTVAHGELVEVDGVVGVRILALEPAP
jgi:flagellar motor switch/type III secretory pathway protein FliN